MDEETAGVRRADGLPLDGTDVGLPAVRFGPSIEPFHHRFDPADVDDVYVVGDVHGCLDELRALWDRLDPHSSDVVVFVGDLVRKGPASAAVVEFVAARDNAVSVRGNNEAKLLRGEVDPDWAPAVVDDLAAMPLAVSWGASVAVHGGVHPDRPFVEHDRDDLLETRAIPPGNGYGGPFWFDLYAGPPRVFFGHTVLESPFRGDGAVGLDTGCVYGGSLSAYDCRRDRFVSVPAAETYRERDHAKIIDA
jgi:serine/threonine protein phosphatase 1